MKIPACVTTTVLPAFLVSMISTGQLHAQQHRVQIGAAIEGGSARVLTDYESSIGRKTGAVRRYRTWDDRFPSSNDINLFNGRDLVLSIKPSRNGRPIRWADIARARPGDSLYQDMVDWADAIRPYESQIWLSFHHEPEAGPNTVYGDSDDFVAAWRNFMGVFDRENVDLAGRVWIATGFAFRLRESDRRHPDKWYPGDGWTDAIAADAFNWSDCRRGSNEPWRSPRSIFEPIRDFGRNYPDKHLMIGEYGSVEDPSNRNRKAQWITDFRNLFKEPGYSQFTLLAYFDVYHDEGIYDCDWRIRTSSAATNAYAALANDPFYQGSGTAAGNNNATSPVPAASGVCTAVRNGNNVTLNWNTNGTNIRRNGIWYSTVPDGTTTVTDGNAPASATYLIRDWSNDRPIDVSCDFDANAPANPCVVAFNGNRANFVFGVPGTIQLRKNGNWLASTSGTYTDSSASASDIYVARTRDGRDVIDYSCTTG